VTVRLASIRCKYNVYCLKSGIPLIRSATNPLQVDTGQICGGDGTFDCVESPFAAIKRLNVGGSTTLAVGSDLIDAALSTAELRRAAVAAAEAADVVVLVIGIGQCGCMSITDTYMGGVATNPHGCATSVVPPYTPWGNCWNHKEVAAGAYVGAEAHDRMLIGLAPPQRKLAAAVFAVGKPTVLVLLNGGSIDVGPELAASGAAIEAFYPGLEGAGVIANALFAVGPDANRFGRMPYVRCLVIDACFCLRLRMLRFGWSNAPNLLLEYC
jgi:hypothetical protein